MVIVALKVEAVDALMETVAGTEQIAPAGAPGAGERRDR